MEDVIVMLANKYKEYALEIEDSIWYLYQNELQVCLRIFNNNSFKEEKVIVDQCRFLLSVILTKDNTIYIFVQSMDNSILMYCLTKDTLTSSIITTNYISNDYIEIISLNNCLNVIYSKTSDNSTFLYHRTIKSDLKLTAPLMLDLIDNSLPYSFIATSQGNNIYICYNKKMKNSCLGFRQYDTTKNLWGNFTILDSSYLPIEDYSFIVGEGGVLAYSYKVNSQRRGQLKYGYGTSSNIVRNTINITSKLLACSVAFFHGKFFFSYVSETSLSTKTVDLLKGICGSKDIDMNPNSVTFKVHYQSNNPIILNTIFFSKDDEGSLVTDSSYYYSLALGDHEGMEVKEFSNSSESLKETANKLIEYEKQLFDKQQLINSLEATIKDLRYKSVVNEDKLKNLSKTTTINDEENLKLKSTLSSLYANILSKENKITELEKNLTEKYNIVSTYKNKIEELNKVIFDLENQISNYKSASSIAQASMSKEKDTSHLEELNKTIETLKNQLSLKDKNITQITQKNAELINQINALNVSIEELSSKQKKSSFIKRIFNDEE
jgi:predicted  nucleic acid-binding Zn-ribbon protein